MLQVLKEVNRLYPLELDLSSLPSKKEVVELLLAEVNQVRKFDEQDSITLDKNDIATITLNEDLTVTVGVRTFIPHPDPLSLEGNDKKYLIEYSSKDDK
jgi:hypothetical protein